MKKTHYPLGYKMVLFLAFQYFLLGHISFAVASSTSEDKAKEMSDRVFKILVEETQEKQERQGAVSTILKENNVIGVVFEKDDGSFCQVSKQETPEDYIPSFMKTGDSLEDFGLSECGEEELATLEETAQVAAVDGGPSQAKVALAPATIAMIKWYGVEAIVGCGLGVFLQHNPQRNPLFDSPNDRQKKSGSDHSGETATALTIVAGIAAAFKVTFFLMVPSAPPWVKVSVAFPTGLKPMAASAVAVGGGALACGKATYYLAK